MEKEELQNTLRLAAKVLKDEKYNKEDLAAFNERIAGLKSDDAVEDNKVPASTQPPACTVDKVRFGKSNKADGSDEADATPSGTARSGSMPSLLKKNRSVKDSSKETSSWNKSGHQKDAARRHQSNSTQRESLSTTKSRRDLSR